MNHLVGGLLPLTGEEFWKMGGETSMGLKNHGFFHWGCWGDVFFSFLFAIEMFGNSLWNLEEWHDMAWFFSNQPGSEVKTHPTPSFLQGYPWFLGLLLTLKVAPKNFHCWVGRIFSELFAQIPPLGHQGNLSSLERMLPGDVQEEVPRFWREKKDGRRCFQRRNWPVNTPKLGCPVGSC